MGLAGRRVKQRISADPRNLAWADDAAKFGSSYLSKFGWDASKGLGVNGEGRTSHIKVNHKLDMLGIGAAHQKDPNGIAWKQNRDFENLLKRLNENVQDDSNPSNAAEEVKEETIQTVEEGSDSNAMERKRKRREKRGDSEGKVKKKRKEEIENEEDGTETTKFTQTQEGDAKTAEPVTHAKPVVPRNRAHRARAIALKSMVSKSSVHLAEILGIAPTPPSTSSGSETPVGPKLTPIEDGTIPLEKLTTSTKSVADYFKEKLLAKSSKSRTQTPLTTPPDSKEEDPYDMPRCGLGASRLKMDIETSDAETQQIGISKFSSLMSSSFLSSTAISNNPSAEDSTPSGIEVPTKTKKEKRKKDSGKIEESEEARELRKRGKKEKKEKKRQMATREDAEKSEKDADGYESAANQESKKERRRKREKDLSIRNEAENEETAVLSKEERRRLRKEKKSRKDSSS